jgi:hypothetical protein
VSSTTAHWSLEYDDLALVASWQPSAATAPIHTVEWLKHNRPIRDS